MNVARYTAADVADFAAHRHEEFVNGKDYDALSARLSSAAQERRDLQESVRNLNTVYENCCATRLAAGARAKAALQALKEAHEVLCGCEHPGRVAFCVQYDAFVGYGLLLAGREETGGG